MDEGEKPKVKLNLRGSADSDVEPEIKSEPRTVESTGSVSRPSRKQPPSNHLEISGTVDSLKSKTSVAGDTLRSRGKKPKAEISEVWDDLRDIQLQSEESLLANREVKELVGVIKTASKKAYKRAAAAYDNKSKATATKASSSAKASKQQQSGSKEENAGRLKWSAKKSFRGLSRRKQTFVMVAIFGSVLFIGNNILSNDKSPGEVNGANSDRVARSSNQESGDLVTVNDTAFDMIFPSGKSAADFKVVRVSPPDNDPAYAYVDTLSGTPLNISQQQMPESIRGDVETGLKDLAVSFNANDTIIIDDYTIYYGYSESTGGVQSLIFVKNELLVFISSPGGMSDDVWANYISRLN